MLSSHNKQRLTMINKEPFRLKPIKHKILQRMNLYLREEVSFNQVELPRTLEQTNFNLTIPPLNKIQMKIINSHLHHNSIRIRKVIIPREIFCSDFKRKKNFKTTCNQISTIVV